MQARVESRATTWSQGWERKVIDRVGNLGCAGIGEFLARFPGEPYVALAKRLGNDVAALQLEWMHIRDAATRGDLRQAAMDSLARDLNRYLPNGWRQGAKGDFETSSAFAVWATRLQQYQPDLHAKANAIWDALEELKPAPGWSPARKMSLSGRPSPKGGQGPGQ